MSPTDSPSSFAQRFCFVDHPLSSPFVGRTLATFAEISFAAQLSASLRSVAPRAGDVRVLSYIITALCTVAQVFCWIGVATQQTWYSAVEESLWAVAATLMLLCASLTLLRGASVGYEWTVGCRRLLLGVLLTAPGYIAYMVLVDVPMYLARHAAHVQLNKPFYPLKEGVLDMFRCEVTGKWADWAEEPSWMTPYFVGALYVSICLADPPAPVKRAPAQKKMQ